MIVFRSAWNVLFRYDCPDVSSLILEGSIKVTTLQACRIAEDKRRRDAGEGTKTTTSLPGRDSLNGEALAKLFRVDPTAIRIGPNAVVTKGSSAVRRTERMEDAFVFCASTVENDPFLKAQFGDGCVKIKEPVAFFTLIDQELRRTVASTTKLNECVVDDIEYAARINNYVVHTRKHCAFIKPRGDSSQFEKESEVRALWVPRCFPIKPVILTIPDVKRLLERA